MVIFPKECCLSISDACPQFKAPYSADTVAGELPEIQICRFSIAKPLAPRSYSANSTLITQVSHTAGIRPWQSQMTVLTHSQGPHYKDWPTEHLQARNGLACPTAPTKAQPSQVTQWRLLGKQRKPNKGQLGYNHWRSTNIAFEE